MQNLTVKIFTRKREHDLLNEYFSTLSILIIILQLLPLILFFSILGSLIGLIIKDRIIFIQICFILIIIASAGMGALGGGLLGAFL